LTFTNPRGDHGRRPSASCA